MPYQGSLDRDLILGRVSGTAPLVFTIPAGQNWAVGALLVRWSAAAGVGGRLVACEIRDGADAIQALVVAGTNVVQNLTVACLFGCGQGPTNTVFGASPNAALHAGWPSRGLLLAGWDVRVFDLNSVDGTDTAVVSVHAEAEAA